LTIKPNALDSQSRHATTPQRLAVAVKLANMQPAA
jgi:hypothetical protein